MRPPFFILGTQRSGTTLLHSILNSHPDLFVLNEFWDLYPFVTNENRDLGELEKVLAQRLQLPATMSRSERTLSEDPFDLVDAAFQQKLEAVGKSRWGIKHPRLTYYLEPFRRRYPQARFVFLLRDARGVVQSYLTRKMNVANVLHGALLWTEQVQIHERFVAAYPDCCLMIRFEDLLAEPARLVRQICEFLDESYSPELLDYHKGDSEVWIHDGNVNITRPIQKEIGEKWRHRLSRRQIAIIESHAGEVMARFGYSREGYGAHVSAPERWFYDLHQAVMTTYWWQRRTHWQGVKRRLLPFAGGKKR